MATASLLPASVQAGQRRLTSPPSQRVDCGGRTIDSDNDAFLCLRHLLPGSRQWRWDLLPRTCHAGTGWSSSTVSWRSERHQAPASRASGRPHRVGRRASGTFSRPVRHIELPEEADNDPPDARTVEGVGNRKNDLLLQLPETTGVGVYEGALPLGQTLRARGVSTAVVSASENTQAALAAAGITELFDACVDGHVVIDLRTAGKPAPDSYLEGPACSVPSPPSRSSWRTP